MEKFISFMLVLIFTGISYTLNAQCAMCKGSVQTSDYAKSINNGIEYLLMAPIILVFAIIFLWIRNKDKFHTKES